MADIRQPIWFPVRDPLLCSVVQELRSRRPRPQRSPDCAFVLRPCNERPWLDIDTSNLRGQGTSNRHWNSLPSVVKKRASQIPVAV